MPQMTAAKAVAAFLSSLVALIAMFGVATDWATPSVIEAVAAILGAVITAAITYRVPNKPKA